MRNAAAVTRREGEIARLVAEGLTNRDIATRLVLSARTGETHVQNILTKAGFTRRAQIAAWFTGLGPPTDTLREEPRGSMGR